MKRLSLLSFVVIAGVLLALVVPAGAAGKGKSAKSCAKTCAAKRGEITVMGPIKGEIKDGTFVITPKGGAVTVKAAKAVVKNEGKTTTLEDLKPGTVVKVKGHIRRKTITATEVCVCSEAKKAGRRQQTRPASVWGPPVSPRTQTSGRP